MNRPNRKIINAIEAGANLLGLHGVQHSSRQRLEELQFIVRLLLENIGWNRSWGDLDTTDPLTLFKKVTARFSEQQDSQTANALRLGWALGLYDEKVQKVHPETFGQLLLLAEPLGITESDISQLVSERTTIHQENQASILLKHLQGWMRTQQPSMRKFAFLCHASEDKEKIWKVSDWLNSQGFSTWLDKKDILPGANWDLEIKNALKNATVVIIFLSSVSVNKQGYVRQEMRIALDTLKLLPEEQIFLIPAMLEPCKIPRQLQSRQAVMLYEQTGFDLLRAALQTQLTEVS